MSSSRLFGNIRKLPSGRYQARYYHLGRQIPADDRYATKALARAWHGRLAKSGLHANTVAKVYRLLRTMMDTAVDDGLLRANPVHIKGAAVERNMSDDLRRSG